MMDEKYYLFALFSLHFLDFSSDLSHLFARKRTIFFFQNTNYEHFLKILSNDVILQTAAQRLVNNIYIYIYTVYVCIYEF